MLVPDNPDKRALRLAESIKNIRCDLADNTRALTFLQDLAGRADENGV